MFVVNLLLARKVKQLMKTITTMITITGTSI
jgi:hypothetical protein